MKNPDVPKTFGTGYLNARNYCVVYSLAIHFKEDNYDEQKHGNG